MRALLWLLVLPPLIVSASCGESSTSSGAGRSAEDPDASFDAATSDAGDAATDAGATDAGDAATDAGSCGEGATLVEDHLACPGSPPSPPPSLIASATAGVRGDVIALGTLDEPSAPCIPVHVCAPDDAATMIFSDEPESPSSDGVLYADTLAPARSYRVYVYHANGGASLRKFPVVVLNQGAADAHVTITRRGVAGPSTSYIAIGKEAAAAWLAPIAPAMVTIPAGTRVLLDQDLDARHAKKDELVHAIFDLTTDAAVKLSIVTLPPAADAAAATAGLDLLPNTMSHTRGTFAGADLLLVAADAFGAAGVRKLVIGGDVVDRDLTGTSAVDNQLPVKLGGNYGVRYRLRAGVATRSVLAFSARGGAWGAAATLPAGDDAPASTTLLPSMVDALDPTTLAVLAGRYPAASGIDLAFVSAGGSSLPVDLLAIPIP